MKLFKHAIVILIMQCCGIFICSCLQNSVQAQSNSSNYAKLNSLLNQYEASNPQSTSPPATYLVPKSTSNNGYGYPVYNPYTTQNTTNNATTPYGVYPNTRVNLLKMFLGGEGSNDSNNSNLNQTQQSNTNSSAEYNACQYWQKARSYEMRARGAADRANSGSDKSYKQSQADEAAQDAESARYAANQAWSYAQGGSESARNYAAKARADADRAQSYASQARSNASGGGW